LSAKYGGNPVLAPALAEAPDVDPAHIEELIRNWDLEPIFQTGVGTRALFAVADSLGLTGALLRIGEKAVVIARAKTRNRAPFTQRAHRSDCWRALTTHEVLAELRNTPLRGKKIVVQRYGQINRELKCTLESQGAEVIEIVTYRWALPEDTAPLLRLIGALCRSEIDVVAFTSASQATNLFTVAHGAGKEAVLKQSLDRTLVASIGPIFSATLRRLGVRVDVEANPPKLGPLIEAINAALSVAGTAPAVIMILLGWAHVVMRLKATNRT
jgi:uroporphyrinogen-III synthase